MTPIKPIPTACKNCGMVAAETVCHICKVSKVDWLKPHPGDRAVGITTAFAFVFIAAILGGVL